MARKINYNRNRKPGKYYEEAFPYEEPADIPQSNRKREPVRIYNPEEIETFKRERGLQGVTKLAYTVPEVCYATGLGRTTIYRLFRTGDLRKSHLAGRTVVHNSDLAAFVAGASQNG